MQMGNAEVDRCLSALRALGAAHRLTDIHVHPFEVLLGPGRYSANPRQRGIWSAADVCYPAPMTTPFDLDSPPGGNDLLPPAMRERLALLFLRRLYLHTGPQCFRDQMSLGGISRALLLPVARPGTHPEKEMATLAAMFGSDPSFLLGYSVPGVVAEEAIEADLRRAVHCWEVRAVKVHPDLSRLELTTAAGRQRLEAILAAAGRFGLPIILHSGASPSPGSPVGRGAALLENLEAVDFGLTRQPVVLAHAGAFGFTPEETAQRVLPSLERLLARFDHLSVDISALPAGVLATVLPRVEPERVLFGSDALYDLPWKALVRLFTVLERLGSRRCEELLVRMAGTNPDRLLGKESKNAGNVAHQISPVS